MASIEDTEALADRLASALARMVDDHYCGHCCDEAVAALNAYELAAGRPAVPYRLHRRRTLLGACVDEGRRLLGALRR